VLMFIFLVWEALIIERGVIYSSSLFVSREWESFFPPNFHTNEEPSITVVKTRICE
jgi:hypothetical protein